MNWFCTFSNTTSLSLSAPACSCEWNLCHEIARVWVYLHIRVCKCVKFFFTLPFAPPVIFYAKFLLACSTCLLCTTLCLLVCFSIILRPIICSHETKLNFYFFFIYFFCFHQVRRLCCCCCLVFLFSLQRAMCTADVTVADWEWVSVYWWARVPTLMRGGGACVYGWGCLNSCFFVCFASGKRD